MTGATRAQKGYGNGDVVTQSYDFASRLLSLGITNGASLVACYDYGWDVGGNILAITNNSTNIVLYGYDRAGQLTNEISFTNGIAGFTTNSWQYDEAGNWRNASASTKWLYNADNELVARAPSGTADVPSGTTTTITGEVEPGPASNKWYNTWAECKGIQARVGTNTGTFSVPNVPVDQWGENILTVTVTDVSGNSSTQQRRVIKQVTDASETFKYDGNGNLTNWVCGSTNWVYEWDWADRLSKVTSNGVVVLENWYDAGSHRIAKAEVSGSTINRYSYLYDGWDIVALTTSSGVLYDSFTRGVALAGDIGGLIAVTRNNQRYYLLNNHRGDVTHVRMNNITLSTHRYTAFGEIIDTTTSNSRFRFSSKERDPSTGMYYYGYRFYAPQWQRWVNADPIGEYGGIELFSFLGNEPISAVDPGGLTAVFPLTPLKTACAAILGYKALIRETSRNTPRWRYAHCMASCEISKWCGRDAAIGAGLAKEVLDLLRCLRDRIRTGRSDSGACYSAFQPSDFRDNARGILCPPWRSCASQCASLENALDGPPGPFYY